MPTRTSPHAFDLVDALDGFFTVSERSSTLDGSLPHRAVRGCVPVLHGSSLGRQLIPTEPALLERQADGRWDLRLTDAAYDKVGEDVAPVVDDLARRGLLIPGGYWHRRLRAGLVRRRAGFLSLWTGLLVRPAEGTAILQSGAYNRRCRVGVQEVVIAGDEGFVPVVIELDMTSVVGDELWLDTELACLVPVVPGVATTVERLDQAPEVGRRVVDFYTPEYACRRAEGRAGDYAQLTARAPRRAAHPARCRLVVVGPGRPRGRWFTRHATASGVGPAPAERRVTFGEVRNPLDVTGRWDGRCLRDLSPLDGPAQRQAVRTWVAAFGEEVRDTVEALSTYTIDSSAFPHRDEPYLAVMPWVLADVPPGWSTIQDGIHRPGLEGLRGVVHSDLHPVVSTVFRFDRPGHFHLRRGDALLRVVPIPRVLQQAGVRHLDLADAGCADPLPDPMAHDDT
ncbi:MAG: hypothetical protein AB7L84_13165 [Acidimicrobiia bacterium]